MRIIGATLTESKIILTVLALIGSRAAVCISQSYG